MSKLLANDVDPSLAKREEKLAKVAEAAHTFESVARDWLEKTAAKRTPGTQAKLTTWLEKDVFPFIGKVTMSDKPDRAWQPGRQVWTHERASPCAPTSHLIAPPA